MDLREHREHRRHAGSRHPWELVRPEIVRRLLPDSLAGGQPRVILDLGCGDAFVVQELADRFPAATFAAVDVELDDEFLPAIRARLAGRPIALYRTLDDARAAATRPADAVLLLDVLEHVADDVRFLEELRATGLMTAGTWMLVTVPAYQRLFSAHDRFLGHYRRYDPHVLRDRLSRAGFRVVDDGAFFGAALLYRWLQVLGEGVAGRPAPPTGIAAWRGGQLATALLTRLLLADFACGRLLRRAGIRVPGLSEYVLCQPSAS